MLRPIEKAKGLTPECLARCRHGRNEDDWQQRWKQECPESPSAPRRFRMTPPQEGRAMIAASFPHQYLRGHESYPLRFLTVGNIGISTARCVELVALPENEALVTPAKNRIFIMGAPS